MSIRALTSRHLSRVILAIALAGTLSSTLAGAALAGSIPVGSLQSIPTGSMQSLPSAGTQSIAAASPAPSQPAPACAFVLGFATLDSLIAQAVGTCRDNQAFGANGDALQYTTGGLLVWRKADNWTAFTDGYHTWINGPKGLEERLNTQRFSWEPDHASFPIAADATSSAPQPAAQPSVPVVKSGGTGFNGCLPCQTMITSGSDSLKPGGGAYSSGSTNVNYGY
ncbi:MAG: hypothetical protein ACYDAG_08040 [Chloroflexota bacterium]